jgi:hypothetical protein
VVNTEVAMIILSPCQSRVYAWLAANVDPGERTPPITEIAAGCDIAASTVHISLAALAKVGLLSATRSTYADMWIYELLIPDASYEIRRSRHQPRGEVDEYALRRLWEY